MLFIGPFNILITNKNYPIYQKANQGNNLDIIVYISIFFFFQGLGDEIREEKELESEDSKEK